MRYATTAQDYGLPPPQPMPPSIVSVPRPDGTFDYYQTPPGYAPPLGDNWPAPSLRHSNPIGVASTAIGRPVPPGSQYVGSGPVARGSISPMPGIGGALPNLRRARSEDGTGLLGLGQLEGGGLSPWPVVLAAALAAGALAWRFGCPGRGAAP